MKSKKLRDAFQYVDDQYLQITEEAVTASGKSGSWKRWSAAAACVVLLIVAGIFQPRNGSSEVPMAHESNSADSYFAQADQDAQINPSTSETYDSLEELLADLSSHESHTRTMEDNAKGGQPQISGVEKAQTSVRYQQYMYRTSAEQEGIEILKINGETWQKTGQIEVAASQLFVCEDRLICVGEIVTGGTELDYELSTQITVLELTEPEEPQMIDEFTQLGTLTACYLQEDQLYLATADGVCACGWSRLENTEDYLPQLRHGSTEEEWTENEINILGEPLRVQYVAVSRIDMKQLCIQDHQAFYGDVSDFYYGANWFAIVTAAKEDETKKIPDIYIFSAKENIKYDGKISLTNEMMAEIRPEGLYPEIKSVVKSGDRYRILALYCNQDACWLLAMTAELQENQTQTEWLTLAKKSGIDEILWEQDRAIVSISVLSEKSNDEIVCQNQFVFIEFDGSDITIYQNELKVDHVAGVDMMYYYGDPYGNLQTLIPLENGIYLRYNETPDGLDIYDFSDSGAPVCLYRSKGDVEEGCRFDFENSVYNDHTFGIQLITPDENGEYRNAGISWLVYEVDPSAEEPFTLLGEYEDADTAAIIYGE